jgi:hypothetical protein
VSCVLGRSTHGEVLDPHGGARSQVGDLIQQIEGLASPFRREVAQGQREEKSIAGIRWCQSVGALDQRYGLLPIDPARNEGHAG